MYLFDSFLNLENFDIYAFGLNEYGELALNDKINKSTPEKIKFFQNEKIVNIAGRGGNEFFISGKINIKQFISKNRRW